MEMQRQLPIPIKLEEASQDHLEIIDLDSGTSSEDIILEWCTKVRMKFKYFFVADSERNLDIIMKWYIQTFKEDAMMIEDSAAVKPQLFKHIAFFKLFFHELDCSFTDNYLDNMEELLAIYSDLEVKTLPRKQNEMNKRAYKKSISKVCHRIIGILNAFLLYREDRLTHVVMKMKLNLHSDETKDVLNLLYGKILTKDPTNKSDLAFCRAYILYQKWKKIRSPDEWEQMDALMYKTYNRTPESLGTNSTLKQILLPQSESVLDVLSHISDNYTVITQEYFKIIKTQNVQEDNLVLLDLTSIELDDQSSSDAVIDLEDEEFEHAYNNYVESMSKISESCNVVDSSCMKSEIAQEEEEECQIVGVGTLDCEPKNVELVHEIIDDEDDDIIDIIFFENKQENPVSFLDSIDVTENRAASSTILSTCVPSSTSSGISSSYTVSPPAVERDTTPARPPEVFEQSPEIFEEQPPEVFEQFPEIFEQPPEIFEQPPVSLSSEDEASTIIAPSNCFAVPSQKPPRSRRKKFREPLRKKIIGFRKLNKRRRLVLKKCSSSVKNADKHSRNNCSDTEKPEQLLDVNETIVSDVPKKVNHIETQTDFHHGDQEDIYKRFKGLVTPPSDEHLEDHDIHKESSNVYTDFLPPFQCSTRDRMTETDYLDSSHAKSIEIDERGKFLGSARDIFNSRPAKEETAAQDVQRSPISKNTENDEMPNDRDSESEHFSSEVDSRGVSSIQDPVSGSSCIKEDKAKLLISSSAPSLPASTFCSPTSNDFSLQSRKNTNLKDPSNVLCTSSDIANDYSPSSSTVSLNPKHRRSNESYSAPASPDISSTSHDNDAEAITREGDSDENRTDYGSNSGFLSDTEDDEYNVEEDRNEVATIARDGNLADEGSYLNEGSDEILIEDHFLVSTNEEVDNSSSPINTEVSVVVDRIKIVNDCGIPDSGIPDSGTNKIKDIGSENEHSEKRNGTERCELKQLKVTVPKVNVNSPAFDFAEKKRLQEMMFAKDKKNIHSNWDNLQMHHDLDDIWSGPIEKANGFSRCVNPDKTFDLFDNKTATTAFDAATLSSTSISDPSPSYENIDDFQNYLDNFKDASNSVAETSGQKVPHSKTIGEKRWDQMRASTKSPVKFSDKGLGFLSVITEASRSVPVRKKRIVFAENIVQATPIAHSPRETPTSPLQGILKNTKRNTRPRIPRRMMNLKSLARFNVKPNDPCIQGVPCVVVERMSQSEVDQWNRVSEISRRVRLQKTKARQSLTSAFRIDYDKTTTDLNEYDVIQFNKPESTNFCGSLPATAKQWRPRKSQSKVDDTHEGYKSGDLPYTDKKNGKRKRDNSVSCSQEKHKKRGRPRNAIEKLYS